MLALTYLLLGSLLYAHDGLTPADALSDIKGGEHRPARGWEVALAAAVWCIALALWPLAAACRLAAAVRRRVAAQVTQHTRTRDSS